MVAQKMKVTLKGEMVREADVERTPLDYPGLQGRAEACMGRTQNGDIWAAVGFNTGGGWPGTGANPERLFRSTDDGRTWTGRPLGPTGDERLCGFTVLADDTLLLAVWGLGDVKFHRSTDLGESWESPAILSPAPFEAIGEGFLSLTQLRDGTVLFPVARYNRKPEGVPNEHPQHVFRSEDGGRTWYGGGDPEDSDFEAIGEGPERSWPGVGGTFPGCLETHLLELASGRVLAAFRYSGFQQPWHRDKVEEWGGDPEGDGIGRLFKHVFLGESDDGGRTWRDLRPVLDSNGTPLLMLGECHGQLVQVPDGRVVLVNDRRYPYEEGDVRARVSDDEGRTWSPEVYQVSSGAGYPASVALEDGTIVTVTGNSQLDRHGVEGDLAGSAQAVRWRLPDL
jgi:hypothetical protein